MPHFFLICATADCFPAPPPPLANARLSSIIANRLDRSLGKIPSPNSVLKSVTIAIKLNNLTKQILLAVIVLGIGVCLSRLIYQHFLVRALTDRRVVYTPEALAAAVQRFPQSPRMHLRLAETLVSKADGEASMVQVAQVHAAQAINLSPWDYRGWGVLAVAQELAGEPEKAESSLRVSARLAPKYAEVNWLLGNLLLRQGKLAESLEPFRIAAQANRELLAASYDLLWQASGNDVELLKKFAGQQAEAQLALGQFFAEQAHVTEAANVFRGVERQAALKSPRTADFIASLINSQQYEMARSIWAGLVGSGADSATATTNGIWNGSCEQDPLKGFDQFDWVITPSDYARIGMDRTVAHSGRRALKISFIGRDTTKLKGEVKQLVALQPGASYRLECFAKTNDLVTPEGPRLALLSQNGVVAVSNPVLVDTQDWQSLVVNFTAPTDTTAKYVAIVRIPKFDYDDPTRGTIWFDDFKLTAQ